MSFLGRKTVVWAVASTVVAFCIVAVTVGQEYDLDRPQLVIRDNGSDVIYQISARARSQEFRNMVAFRSELIDGINGLIQASIGGEDVIAGAQVASTKIYRDFLDTYLWEKAVGIGIGEVTQVGFKELIGIRQIVDKQFDSAFTSYLEGNEEALGSLGAGELGSTIVSTNIFLDRGVKQPREREPRPRKPSVGE